MSQRFAVVGHPIDHSRSPEIHAAFAEQFDLHIDYTRIDVREAEFTSTVFSFFDSGGLGLNVTLPHKISAFDMSDAPSLRAQRAGAVNTLYRDGARMVGDNTDGAGLLRDLQRILSEKGSSLLDSSILVLGAGGAARGALAGLIGEGPSSITLAARNPKKTEELLAHFASAEKVRRLEPADRKMQFDLVINTTSAGVAGEVPEIGMEYLRLAGCAYDLSYATSGASTPFLAQAKALRVPIVADGLGMLVEQAAEAFHVWHGVRPVTAQVLSQLRSR